MQFAFYESARRAYLHVHRLMILKSKRLTLNKQTSKGWRPDQNNYYIMYSIVELSLT